MKVIIQSIVIDYFFRMILNHVCPSFTEQTPDGCSDSTYRQLAVTILASFCSDEALLVSEQMTKLLPYINEIITSFDQ